MPLIPSAGAGERKTNTLQGRQQKTPAMAGKRSCLYVDFILSPGLIYSLHRLLASYPQVHQLPYADSGAHLGERTLLHHCAVRLT